ncbi:MAG: phage integrase N-terminal SAM-like domain-containing protein [Rhodanobacter sp.]
MSSFHAAGREASGSGGRSPKLRDQLRERVRRLGMAGRSEETYVGWIRRFIPGNHKRHPRDMGC